MKLGAFVIVIPAFFASNWKPVDGDTGVIRMTSIVRELYQVALRSTMLFKNPMSNPPSSSLGALRPQLRRRLGDAEYKPPRPL